MTCSIEPQIVTTVGDSTLVGCMVGFDLPGRVTATKWAKGERGEFSIMAVGQMLSVRTTSYRYGIFTCGSKRR